ncbi:unnamed protein product [Trichobilharzia regenti]|nr:unnamed protein product [Trichobilharzia regenti]
MDDLLAELESSVAEVETRRPKISVDSKTIRTTPKRQHSSNYHDTDKPTYSQRRSPERSERRHNFSEDHPQRSSVSENDYPPHIQPSPRPRNPFSCRGPTETDPRVEENKTKMTEDPKIHVSQPIKDTTPSFSEMDVAEFTLDFEAEITEPKELTPNTSDTKPASDATVKPITDLTASWLAAENLVNTDDATWIIETDSVSFPSSSNKGNVLYFYWFDAYEDSKQLPDLGCLPHFTFRIMLFSDKDCDMKRNNANYFNPRP